MISLLFWILGVVMCIFMYCMLGVGDHKRLRLWFWCVVYYFAGGEGWGSENVHFGRCRFSSLYAAALGLWWLCDILQMNNCIDISLQYSRWFAAMTIALHGLWHWIGSRHT
ncbi:uncharacterized protein BO66DRAFT_151101 [Aspergillus aculeatinus CBS 121060]|uniref:Uncharacterized protein n=1 Tax=Aspergillus aculeatinus CBS 121060 TaxID=1448322 RepID=A0ACD1H289_9EURO|nr:hypothetical protein BO66DRAFT_151101 [Aspergillus aculeatinus CBS 121060]RAH67693.1 hypothetical protein BO66DRAFT_151101 [Aspergillus aculeatinus CBS 121060]